METQEQTPTPITGTSTFLSGKTKERPLIVESFASIEELRER